MRWVGDGSLWQVDVNLFYSSQRVAEGKKWSRASSASERSWGLALHFVLKTYEQGSKKKTREEVHGWECGSLSLGVEESRVLGIWPSLIMEGGQRIVGRCCLISLKVEKKSLALKGWRATFVPQNSDSIYKKRCRRAYSWYGINNELILTITKELNWQQCAVDHTIIGGKLKIIIEKHLVKSQKFSDCHVGKWDLFLLKLHSVNKILKICGCTFKKYLQETVLRFKQCSQL